MCPFTASAPNSLGFVRAFYVSKLNSTTEAWGLRAMYVCVWGPSIFAVFIFELRIARDNCVL
jgi:hypothetical protein